LYRLRLRPSLVGWAGEAIATDAPEGWTEDADGSSAFFLEFTVAPGASTAPTPDPDPPDQRETGPTMVDLFAPGAVFDPDRALCSCHTDPNTVAQARLDLSDPGAAFDGLVIPSRLRETGFPMVSPRRPSESFLLQKLLRDDDGRALHGVLGDPMPPESSLPYADWVTLARWIESGARL
jgi:hypothetical protein